jgi:hypothetical protein
MSKRCPACGSAASGRFCSDCGAELAKPSECSGCGNQIAAGARFCNMCGAPATAVESGADAASATEGLAPRPNPARSNLPWYLAGAAIAVLIAVLLSGRFRSTPPPIVAGVPGGNPGAVDLSTLTAEEAAVRLYNRVMESVTVGDSVSARAFAPMALDAYALVEELDLDDRYHVALLHLVNGDPRAARREADTILEQVPTHLYGLFMAAQSEEHMGNRDAAVPLYRAFLDNYEGELALGRSEYAAHPDALRSMFDDASRAVGTTAP